MGRTNDDRGMGGGREKEGEGGEGGEGGEKERRRIRGRGKEG